MRYVLISRGGDFASAQLAPLRPDLRTVAVREAGKKLQTRKVIDIP